MPPKKIKTQRANEKNPVNKTRKAPVIVAVNKWYDVPVDEKIFGDTPVLNEDNMNATYANRREHLTNWMIRLLQQNPNKQDFRICNQKSGNVKGDLKIKDDIYLSTIPKDAASIKTLVDYYAFDYAGVTNQVNPQFLNSPKFVFNNGNYVDLSKYKLHQMNASGNENSCGFFALLQAISPFYRALNYPAKIFITHEFRNSYVPTIIVNEKGAPMSTKEYKTPSMGGDATTNELDVVRAKYNEYDSETSARHKFMEYLNGSQNQSVTGISMHIRNSWFFGFNVVSISARTQNSVTGKYKFFKDEIEGPEHVDETIFICNISSVHYMTIGIEHAGKIEFVFNETNPDIKEMIDDISIKGTATDVVTKIETELSFENIDIIDVARKILNDQNTGVTIDVILNIPKSNTDVFAKELDFSILGLKMFTDNESTLGTDWNKILCLAFDHTTNKYYYVLSYKLSAADPNVEIYHVAGIAKVDKKLTISNNYVECGTIQYNNLTGVMDVKLDVCDLPAAPPKPPIIVAVPPNPTIVGVPPPAPPPNTIIVGITPDPTIVGLPANPSVDVPANPTIVGVSPDPNVAVPANPTIVGLPANPTIVGVSPDPNVAVPANPTIVAVPPPLGPPPKNVIPIVNLDENTCIILVKFKLDNGTLDVDSVNIDVDTCDTALPFPDDFSTIVPGQDYLFTINYDPANLYVSTVTDSKTQLQCDAEHNLKTKLDALFAA